MSRMRICVGPHEVAGVAAGLVAGLRSIGVEADAVLGAEHRFGYRADGPQGFWPRLWIRLGNWRRRVPATRTLTKATAVLLHRTAGWVVLLRVLWRYDAFVFLFGETFTNTTFELRLMRRLGRRTLMIFLGSEARPPAIDGGLFPFDRDVDGATLERATRRQRERVQRIESLVGLCINAPATAQFHLRPVVDWFALGIPRVVPPHPPVLRHEGPLRLLHSPSNRALKGSDAIDAMVRRLSEQGLPIEWITLENVPNERVNAEIARADLVLDQLYSDTPMAAFATEAAALGRPVLVGSYFAEFGTLNDALPIPPTLFMAPSDFEAELQRLAVDAEARQALGERGRIFVAAHWRPEAVAQRLLRMLRGDIESHWWLDPASIRYVHGCGLPVDVVAQRLRTLIEHGGRAALGVADKPGLEDAFVALAVQGEGA
jgi:hypothetical protein